MVKETNTEEPEDIKEEGIKDENPPEDESLEEEMPSGEDVPESPDVETEVSLMKDQLLRALAEAENVRRRAALDREEALKYSISNFARELLAVADNLRRAMDHLPKESTNQLSDEMKALVEGVEMTEKELLSAFEKHGIKKVTPMGEKFNHDLHQAMFEIETDEHEPGIIVELMQSGYVIHDRLLRPAMVGVAKKLGEKKEEDG